MYVVEKPMKEQTINSKTLITICKPQLYHSCPSAMQIIWFINVRPQKEYSWRDLQERQKLENIYSA